MPVMSHIEIRAEKRGEERGKKLGEKRGRRAGLLQAIEPLFRWKFGEAGTDVLAEIRKLKKLEVLQAVAVTIPTAATPEELRRFWI